MNWRKFFGLEKRQTLEQLLISAGVLTVDVSKEQALAIPAVSACVSLICNTIASLPVQLYKDQKKGAKLITDDPRIGFLNDETMDTLDAFQMKYAFVEDYLLEGGGWIYIDRARNTAKGLYFVENQFVNVVSGPEPIKKKYTINIYGQEYKDWEFVKLLRKTKNGSKGKGIIDENNKMLSVAYNSMVYEETLVKTGGNKKGFLKSQTKLGTDSIQELKDAWKKLYQNNTENVIILNSGIDFQEAQQSSVELQMNEQKVTNSNEICKLFLVPPRVLTGEANDDEYNIWIKTCIAPILTAFETALNRDYLLPSERGDFYWAFDLNELQKGDLEKRFKAYSEGIGAGFVQIDEVRYRENLPPLGLKWLKLGLQDVLYFPDSDEIYTPNTNKLAKMGEDNMGQVNQGQTDPNNPNQPNGTEPTNPNQPNPNDPNVKGGGKGENLSNNTGPNQSNSDSKVQS